MFQANFKSGFLKVSCTHKAHHNIKMSREQCQKTLASKASTQHEGPTGPGPPLVPEM